jgi:DNA invertase Pin-like site-specific DNA recombinase
LTKQSNSRIFGYARVSTTNQDFEHSTTLDAAGTDPLCAAAVELHFAG